LPFDSRPRNLECGYLVVTVLRVSMIESFLENLLRVLRQMISDWIWKVFYRGIWHVLTSYCAT
jgi:hypothetical protein